MSNKELVFDTKKLAERKPLLSVEIAIEEINSFPVGILTDEERNLFAETIANLHEVQLIARRKGIELGFPVKKPGFWDRFKKQPRQSSETKQQEIKYNGLQVHLLTDDESVASSNNWTIRKANLDPNKVYKKYGKAHHLPHEDDHFFDHEFLRASRFGRDFITLGYIDKLTPEGETLIQLKEHKGLPVFIVNVEKRYGSFKAIGAYTIEPTDAENSIYHVCFPSNIQTYKDRILQVRKTGKKETFEVTQLIEEDPQ